MAKIIIQENDGAVLDVLTQALQMEGHRPIPILGPCPDQMSIYIESHNPDLVLVDYRSNSCQGSSLLDTIRRISSKLPIIVLSCELNIAKAISKLGFTAYLTKPFNLDDLYETINSMLNDKAANRSAWTLSPR